MSGRSTRPRGGGGPASKTPPSPATEPEIPKLYDEHDETATATDQTGVIAPKSFRTTRRATLMAMGGSLTGNVFRLEQERTTIGRSRGANIVLTDEGVSRVHCIVTRAKDGSYEVEDNKSTNGTMVNGHGVTTARLLPGDRVQVGSEAVLQFGFFDEAEEELARKMYEGATRDPLTRALNRRHFFERFAAEVSYATRHDAPLVAVVFDIDHFKSINDSLGHVGGDAVLRDLGRLVATVLRTEDIFARYGGEEFVVVARGLTLKQGAQLAERIRTSVEAASFMFDGRRCPVSVSAGVAALSEATPAKTVEILLRLADERLYRAKAAGRNCVSAR